MKTFDLTSIDAATITAKSKLIPPALNRGCCTGVSVHNSCIEVVKIPIDKIKYADPVDFNSMRSPDDKKRWTELIEDIRQNGILKLVDFAYHRPSDTYWVLDGNHHVQAAYYAGIKEIPGIIWSLPWNCYKNWGIVDTTLRGTPLEE